MLRLQVAAMTCLKMVLVTKYRSSCFHAKRFPSWPVSQLINLFSIVLLKNYCLDPPAVGDRLHTANPLHHSKASDLLNPTNNLKPRDSGYSILWMQTWANQSHKLLTPFKTMWAAVVKAKSLPCGTHGNKLIQFCVSPIIPHPYNPSVCTFCFC